MGSAKKYIDLYFDFFLFMMGLLALFFGFNRVYAFQDSTLLSLTNNELVYTQDAPRNNLGGEDVISFLLSEKSVPIVFCGTVYEKQDSAALLAIIDIGKTYTVERIYGTDNTNTPSKIYIYESEGE